jgi:hypothetical protein
MNSPAKTPPGPSLRLLRDEAYDLFLVLLERDAHLPVESDATTRARRLYELIDAKATKSSPGPRLSNELRAAARAVLRLAVEHPGKAVGEVNDMPWQRRPIRRTQLAYATKWLRLQGYLAPATRRGARAPLVVTALGRNAYIGGALDGSVQ